MSPAGRRPGPQRTRAVIIDAARVEFTANGYTDTTIRSVARAAEVDPALVYHYFGDKVSLFLATNTIPFDPRAVAETAMPGDTPFDGTRLAEQFLAHWERDDPSAQGFVAMAQATAASPDAARAIREFLAARIRTPPPEDVPEGSWEPRHAMIASTLLGMAWARWILRIEPLASAPRAVVASWVGPTLDRYRHHPPGG